MGQGLKRFEDWPERLDNFLSQDFCFDWVNLNCTLFVSDAVLAITGVDHASDYRDITSKKDMIDKMRSSYGDIENATTEKLGKPLSSVNFAMRGDVVLGELENGKTLGLCLGKKAVFLAEKSGLVYRETLDMSKAWRV